MHVFHGNLIYLNRYFKLSPQLKIRRKKSLTGEKSVCSGYDYKLLF